MNRDRFWSYLRRKALSEHAGNVARPVLMLSGPSRLLSNVPETIHLHHATSHTT